MNKNKRAAFYVAILLTSLWAAAFSADSGNESSAAIAPDKMPRIGTVERIHRQIGMSGGLFVNALFREIGRTVSAEETLQLQEAHIESYLRMVHLVRRLPGARELLDYLSEIGVPWAIATSG